MYGKVGDSEVIHAVITADLIGSGNLEIKERAKFVQWIHAFTSEINKETQEFEIVYPLSLFRGDSFQIVIGRVDLALRLALRMQASLLSMNKNKKLRLLDARVGIGIGTINYKSRRIEEADGEAFHFSGKLLDVMKQSRTEKLKLLTAEIEINEEFEIHCLTLDVLLASWSPAQAKVISMALENKTQLQIAESIGESQPAVNQKLRAASFRLVESILNRFEKKMME